MTRQEANLQILDIIKKVVENNPDFRFIQALWSLGIINTKRFYAKDNKDVYYEKILDRFYEESEETLRQLIKL